ncbi:MAG TPA: FtsH protease activity modulator HflK [Pseudohongiella sp.]|nr:FtsH protease activity modulator HflK [Pseudohongiella sp.]MAY55826.1 FtsH protease activity modulator HflK [Gammaproteobacteria bacterium]MBJ55064.1 FtsH protease activity modulator HflK [Gammaproteobacteria bacterium]HBN14545.1 FtsH protease activity modulator HflK [Pseudohongiella sp.]HBX37910.1 FtsH protease activity modulator HflK [Pseudohongiella sp.]|tara:strand:- start:15528 stop:16754 length:1227 start_codon:yes stop_codon:yes gene_type:complete
MAWNEPGNKGNDNDPWGGGSGGGGGRRGGDQGPPDLDEVLRNLSKKINSLLGGKSGRSGGGSSGSGGAGFSAGMLGGVIVLAVVVWAAMGFYTVDEAERGVVLRFGELREEVVMPGLRWNPPLIDEVTKVNISRVNTRSYSNDMLTTDENIVTVSVSVQYVVNNPVQYVVQVREPQRGLDQAVESAIRHVVGGTTMDRVLTQGRAEVAAEVRERTQSYMENYQTGIMVTQVNVENAQPPVAVQAAFDDVIRAREDEQRAQNQALAYANRVIPEARGEAQRIIEQANAYRDEVIARAEGESFRFEQLLAEYQRAPSVTRQRLYIDAIEDVLSNTSKVLVDVEGGNNMMFLPLDRLMSGSMDSATGEQQSGRLQLNSQQLRDLADQVTRELNAQAASSDRSRVQNLPVRR